MTSETSWRRRRAGSSRFTTSRPGGPTTAAMNRVWGMGLRGTHVAIGLEDEVRDAIGLDGAIAGIRGRLHPELAVDDELELQRPRGLEVTHRPRRDPPVARARERPRVGGPAIELAREAH